MDKRATTTIELSTVGKIVRKILSADKSYTINWGGGEPLLLGKEGMRKVVAMDSFTHSKTTNMIYSTFQIKLDAEWKEILDHFDSVMFSLDSYRKLQRGFNAELGIKNIKSLAAEKIISYTPRTSDTKHDLENYYLTALDAGASCFHMGFLYAENLIDPNLYISFFDELLFLRDKYNGPEIGFLHNINKFAGNPTCSVGWRAYDCFTKGMYISHDDIVTSCFIMLKKGYDVPYIRTQDFLSGETDIESLNAAYVRQFFFATRPPKCLDCEYYALCMGGCPYFTARSADNVDYYCNTYRRIFEELLDIVEA
jgi:radical SAM protein with 4Fe4S-binding SPASM domain